MAWLLIAFGLLSQPVTRPVLARVEAVALTSAVPAGGQTTLVVRVAPRAGINIYAPGVKRYRPISLTLEASEGATADKTLFPDPAVDTFGGERVRVYNTEFDIKQPIRIAAGAAGPVVVRGTVEYQACDRVMCYLPVKVPVRWEVPVR
jgi:DsbC/DsbD-like thiol-disulfide interchange protein